MRTHTKPSISFHVREDTTGSEYFQVFPRRKPCIPIIWPVSRSWLRYPRLTTLGFGTAHIQPDSILVKPLDPRGKPGRTERTPAVKAWHLAMEPQNEHLLEALVFKHMQGKPRPQNPLCRRHNQPCSPRCIPIRINIHVYMLIYSSHIGLL